MRSVMSHLGWLVTYSIWMMVDHHSFWMIPTWLSTIMATYGNFCLWPFQWDQKVCPPHARRFYYYYWSDVYWCALHDMTPTPTRTIRTTRTHGWHTGDTMTQWRNDSMTQCHNHTTTTMIEWHTPLDVSLLMLMLENTLLWPRQMLEYNCGPRTGEVVPLVGNVIVSHVQKSAKRTDTRTCPGHVQEYPHWIVGGGIIW